MEAILAGLARLSRETLICHADDAVHGDRMSTRRSSSEKKSIAKDAYE